MTEADDAPPRQPTEWGYARVSTADQDPAMQTQALIRAGVPPENVFVDRLSGSTRERPGLDALHAAISPGDRITVWKLDRLGRTVKNLVTLMDDYAARGVQFRSLTENIDTTTPTGRFMFHVMSALAEMERDLIQERTRTALALARERGTQGGRRTPVTAKQARHIIQLHYAGTPYAEIAELTGVSRSAVGRVIRNELPSIVEATAAAHAEFGPGGDPHETPVS